MSGFGSEFLNESLVRNVCMLLVQWNKLKADGKVKEKKKSVTFS